MPPRGLAIKYYFDYGSFEIREREIHSWHGIAALLLLIAAILGAIGWLVLAIVGQSIGGIVGAIVSQSLLILLFAGLYMVESNQGAVLTLFGKYVGTVKTQGQRFNNPFYAKRKVSLRGRNFESESPRSTSWMAARTRSSP